MTDQVQKPVSPSTSAKVSSAKPLSALSTEERKARYAELRKILGRSKFEVRGDPTMHYLWAARDDSNEMTRLEMIGYTIVKEPNPKAVLAGEAPAKIQASGLRQDGTYTIGDVILVQCPMDVYEFLMLENEQRAENMLKSAKEDFVVEAEKQGVPTFNTSK